MAEIMLIEPRLLERVHVRIEPVDQMHRDEMRAALDCDPDNWVIQSVCAMGEHFDGFWKMMVATPGRLAFAVRDRASGALAGTSSYIGIDAEHRTLEVGYTWFRPEFRGTAVNPEAKLLMLGHAFAAGAERVQFSVDARNPVSQAAVLKLGGVKEGVIRRHRITWTGHHRDTALFSIISDEWPRVKAGLEARLAAFEAQSG